MPYEIFLALRYLRTHRGRRVAQLTALAAITGIAFGVGALVVALALANGFRDEMRDKILRGTAHITVLRNDGQPITEWRPITTRLRATTGVTDATPTTYDGALLSGPDGAAYMVLRGVDMQSARSLAALRATLVKGSTEPLSRDTPLPDAPSGSSNAESRGQLEDEAPVEALVGAELAARTGLERAGDEGWIITGQKVDVPPGIAPRARRLHVAGIFRSGLYEYDSSWVYAALPRAMRLAGAPAGAASVISVEVADLDATGSVAERVRALLGPRFTVVDWREANRPLFAALALERRTVAFIISLIMIVAALNITTTLVLVVIERRADIAILGAMGARAPSIMSIFMIEGATIGATGALSGVLLGLAACALGDYFKLVRLPADVYSLGAVPFHPRASDIALSAIAAFLVSLLATLYPARSAARVRPAEILRYE